MASRLQLPSLTVAGFRGIRSLELRDLGRVTLLAGKNGIGKTTILEAIRLYASRGDFRSLTNLIETREEFVPGSDEDGDEVLLPDFASLFHEYDPDNDDKNLPAIRIRSRRPLNGLSLQLVDADEGQLAPSLFSNVVPSKELRVSIGKRRRTYPVGPVGHNDLIRKRYRPFRARSRSNSETWPDPIVLESLGPGLLHTNDVARLWDTVALTKAEDFVTNALRMVVGDRLQRLAVIGDASGRYRSRGRRVVAKLNSQSFPIPLKRLGDGAQRLLGIALALANCRNGILLIDEVENGVHYSIQQTLWRMIFDAATEGNLQVVAATHSWDCIAGFAAAACETPEVGTLFRLEGTGDDLHAVSYTEEDLEVAAEQRIEVR